jgi:hypothetical protein
MLNKIIVSTLSDLGIDEHSNWRAINLIKLLTTHHGWWTLLDNPQEKRSKNINFDTLTSILSDSDAQAYLGVNRYQNVLWFNKEAFEDLMWWLLLVACVEITGLHSNEGQVDHTTKLILSGYKVITALLENARASDYQLEKLVDLTK